MECLGTPQRLRWLTDWQLHCILGSSPGSTSETTYGILTGCQLCRHIDMFEQHTVAWANQPIFSGSHVLRDGGGRIGLDAPGVSPRP